MEERQGGNKMTPEIDLVKALRCIGIGSECSGKVCDENCPYWQEKYLPVDDHAGDVCADAADTIERLAAENETQRWIAVEEKLPEVEKCVLVRQTYHPFRNEHGEFEEVTVGYLHQPTDNRRKPYFYWVAVSDYGDMVRAESICPGSK